MFVKYFNYNYLSSRILFRQLWFSYVIMNIHIYKFSFRRENIKFHHQTNLHTFSTISTHPSSLTYFHLHSYPSFAILSWSVNYIDLTPNRTRKQKCYYLNQGYPTKQLTVIITRLGERELTPSSHYFRFQRIHGEKCLHPS
jgi:hypothetical protein